MDKKLKAEDKRNRRLKRKQDGPDTGLPPETQDSAAQDDADTPEQPSATD